MKPQNYRHKLVSALRRKVPALKLTLLLLALTLHAKVPGAATSVLPQQTAQQHSAAAPVLRQLDAQLRALVTALNNSAQPAYSAAGLPLETIEALWQQLFAQQNSPALNKVYNQYQVQLQLLRHADPQKQAIRSEPQVARQLEQLRQQLVVMLHTNAA